MVVRMWHGRVLKKKGASHRGFLRERAIPDHQSVPGLVEVNILERADADPAKCYAEEMDFLLEFEPTVVHDAVVG